MENMETSVNKITKDTYILSAYNSEEQVEKMLAASHKIYAYLNKERHYEKEPQTTPFGGCNTEKVSFMGKASPNELPITKQYFGLKAKPEIEYHDFSNYIIYFAGKESTFDLPVTRQYVGFKKPELINTIYKRLLNIEITEEDEDIRAPIVDEYAVDEVSIDCIEAENFRKKLIKLKKKYGIAKRLKAN